MKVKNKLINNVIASGTDNVMIPTESQNREGIRYKSSVDSNVPNGFFYNLSEAIQFLQFTVGLYDASAEYEEGNICKLLYKDSAGYQLKSFRRTNKNNTIKKGNAPYKPATIETTNGIDCYSEGTENLDWEEIKSGLSAYLFQIEGKTIDDLLNNNYTKENINTFLSKEKFNELYKVCNDFSQIYFLDCLISYKKIGTYTTGSADTGDLKNYKFIELNTNNNGTIKIRFDYNETDDTYNDFYINSLLIDSKKILKIKNITSSITGISQEDKALTIPNMLVIEQINNDIQIIEESSMKQLVIDLDLSLESNKKQTINLLERVKEINPKATKVNFYELVYWQSARQKRLELLGWESKYLLSDKMTFELATTDNEIGAENRFYKTIGKLKGSINSSYEYGGERPVSSNVEVTVTIKSHIEAIASASAFVPASTNANATASASAYASASASANATASATASASANATASASAYATAYASSTVSSTNVNASTTASATASAYASSNAEIDLTGSSEASILTAYADKYSQCYNKAMGLTNKLLRNTLATSYHNCNRSNTNDTGNWINNNKIEGAFNYIQEDIDVPIIIYDDKFELTYTHQTIDKTKTDWTMDENLDNGDILLFKPKLLVSYQ